MTSPASQMTGPIACGKQINRDTTMSNIQIHKYKLLKMKLWANNNNQYTQKIPDNLSA